MGFFARNLAIAASLVCFAQAAVAQGDATQRAPLDLDGRMPAEQLEDMGGYKRVLFWSSESGIWLEVFRAKAITGLVEDSQSYFKRIVADGRQWQWRNEGFVPLIVNEAVAAGPVSNADFKEALQPFEADLASLPENGSANLAFLHRPQDAEPIKAVWLATTSVCAEGGASCPLVILRPGRDPRAIYISLDSAWGFYEAKGKTYVEYQRQAEVVQIDLETGAETVLAMIEPTTASSPPKEPRHAE